MSGAPTSDWPGLLDCVRTQPARQAAQCLEAFPFQDHPEEYVYYATALYHRLHSDLSRAEIAVKQALEAAAVRGNLAIYSDSLLLQSYVDYATFDSAAAIDALRAAQQIKAEIGDTIGEIKIRCNLANLAISQQKLSEAREHHERASAIYGALPPAEQDVQLELYLLNIDGLILEQLGDYEAAARAYNYGLAKCVSAGLANLEPSFGLNYYEALAQLPQAAPGVAEDFSRFLTRVQRPDALLGTLAPARIYRALGQVDAARDAALAVAGRARTQGNFTLELEALIEVLQVTESSASIERADLVSVLAQARQNHRLSETLILLKFIVRDPRFSEAERLNEFVPSLVEVQQAIFDSVRDQTVQNLSRKAAVDNAQRLAEYEQQLRVQAEQTIQRQLEELERGRLFDALTGLPNRVMLLAQLSQRAQPNAAPFLLLTLDVNRFQLINDTYGHDRADEVLRVLARRMQRALAPGDLVARVGGDEFALLLAAGRDPTAQIDRLLQVASQPVELPGQLVRVSVSAGAARWPEHARDAESLRQAAELALLDAKAQGERVVQFDAAAHAHAGLEGALSRALARGEFELHFQPLVDTHARRVVSAEALLRWHSPEHGLQAPGTFMPILERGDQIVEVGAWVLREACRAASGWGGVRVAVNLSARQFASQDLLETVRAALRDADLPPELLELEITESLMMLNPDRTARVLDALRSDGVRVMLDDFGTGYSSLAYLSQFPLSGLKVDRSFVRQMVREPRGKSAAIVRAMVSLSHDLGLELVAEGVEHRGDLECLRAEGIQVMQGYYFARPSKDWRPLLDGSRSALGEE
ncbi:putative bifunctional diguanylate cyclase/phosphodiesterase [Deinococcus sedimenti]|uniref:EAL domain-containing protein n=1 Tax=Deinococcus sedimenti TaxID=1867090 RepID=A0ABQ2S2R7_9DEIO|nr:bifunctional diguanylate cyclase/phosphodiesterase [Deinococcus sedimenti]GGR92266.1 hypothetical protein GCM10008960_18900 [Deinococcus sedimenti]